MGQKPEERAQTSHPSFLYSTKGKGKLRKRIQVSEAAAFESTKCWVANFNWLDFLFPGRHRLSSRSLSYVRDLNCREARKASKIA